MILTLALLLICAANIGTLLLYRQFRDDHAVTTRSLKLMLASLRHDLAVDRGNVDDRFDAVETTIEDVHDQLHADVIHVGAITFTEVSQAIVADGKRTREDIQKATVARPDDETPDRQATRQPRRAKAGEIVLKAARPKDVITQVTTNRRRKPNASQ